MVSYEWVQGNNAGPHLAPVTKLVLHTTEGGSIEGAVAAYEANNSWPHLTVDSRSLRISQHLTYDVAARSLRNQSGGVETNTQGVIQIEVVGRAAEPEGINWEWVGREVVGPVCRETGIPVQSSVTWVAYPDSYGQFAAQRLGSDQWLAYVGILGHQHVPENDHGDPGAIPIAALLAAAQPLPSILEDDDMFVLYDPSNGTHWLVFATGRVQVSGDFAQRAKTAGFKSVSPLNEDADAILNAVDDLLEATLAGNDQRAQIAAAFPSPAEVAPAEG